MNFRFDTPRVFTRVNQAALSEPRRWEGKKWADRQRKERAQAAEMLLNSVVRILDPILRARENRTGVDVADLFLQIQMTFKYLGEYGHSFPQPVRLEIDREMRQLTAALARPDSNNDRAFAILSVLLVIILVVLGACNAAPATTTQLVLPDSSNTPQSPNLNAPVSHATASPRSGDIPLSQVITPKTSVIAPAQPQIDTVTLPARETIIVRIPTSTPAPEVGIGGRVLTAMEISQLLSELALSVSIDTVTQTDGINWKATGQLPDNSPAVVMGFYDQTGMLTISVNGTDVGVLATDQATGELRPATVTPPATTTVTAATEAPTSTLTPEPTRAPGLTVNHPNGGLVNLRLYPSTDRNTPVGTLANGTVIAPADVLGLTPDGNWYKIRVANEERFISASLVDLIGVQVDTLAPEEIPAPPTPTLAPTSTPAAQSPAAQSSPESPSAIQQTYTQEFQLQNTTLWRNSGVSSGGYKDSTGLVQPGHLIKGQITRIDIGVDGSCRLTVSHKNGNSQVTFTSCIVPRAHADPEREAHRNQTGIIDYLATGNPLPPAGEMIDLVQYLQANTAYVVVITGDDKNVGDSVVPVY